ncbi:class I SAM-dependent methyltransferase [Kribbella sp. NPDC058245]|uniref:class I SAM-dependent methyltransferase n=1 Tax=Kribbella sp. NPDC058245 TaxID=3346399 RepID=UPI0036E2F461
MTTPFEVITERVRAAWSAEVDYQPLAQQSVLTSELQVQAAAVRWGDRVLDVAAGTGNTALAAARRGALVTATDFSPVGLDRAVRRAAAEGVSIATEVADAQQLPFEDGSFDVVLSTFGVMYAPDQQRAADELLRVCRPGGRIGLVSWCLTGLMADLQSALGAVLPPPPPGVPSPHLWGTEQRYKELFGDRIAVASSDVLTEEFFAESAQAQVATMLTHLPPWRMLFDRLDPEGQSAMAAAAEGAYERANRATDGTLLADSQYLRIVATAL